MSIFATHFTMLSHTNTTSATRHSQNTPQKASKNCKTPVSRGQQRPQKNAEI
jgi:hypothetical protein